MTRAPKTTVCALRSIGRNAPSAAHQSAEVTHGKQKGDHEVTKARHERIMKTLRVLDAALK